jgi:hypothetical protein
MEQVQNEKSKELRAAKTSVQDFTSEINSKFVSHVSSVGETASELSSVFSDGSSEMISNKGTNDHDLHVQITTTGSKLSKKWHDRTD